MNYYLVIDNNIESGPHTVNSIFIRSLTGACNPECLDLTQYGLLPELKPELQNNQRYNDTKSVINNQVVIGVEDIPLEELKQNKINEIKNSFNNEMYSGKCDTTLGWEVDARRSGMDNDLQNMETLYNTMVVNNETHTYVKGADNQLHSCTLEEVKTIVNQIANKGLWNYQHKHLLEMEIDQCETLENLNLINW